MTSQQQPSLDFDRQTFCPEIAQELKHLGMRIAAVSKAEALELCRHACRMAALSRLDRTATADDAAKFLAAANLEPLGNAAGSLFSKKEWECTGELRASERVSNHSHKNNVWRLR